MIGVTDSALRSRLADRRQRLAALGGVADSAELTRLLGEVDDALERLATGSYGLCTVCHDPVEADRLLADPLTRNCLDCLSTAERRALERDLETASRIQAALLPASSCSVGGWEIHYRYRPHGPVSGDHLDLVRPRSDGDSMFFLFGDVSGKGIAASLLMAHLQAVFRALIPLGLSLAETLERANRLLCEGTVSSSFATLVAGRMEPTGSVRICNAGHWPPLLSRNGQVTPIPSGGVPLGVVRELRFEPTVLELQAGDQILLYTDGLIEARDAAGREYGVDRLGAVLGRMRSRSAEATVGACLDDLAAFGNGKAPDDDLTIMVVRRTGTAVPAGRGHSGTLGSAGH